MQSLRRCSGIAVRLLGAVSLAVGSQVCLADAPFLRLETATVEHDDERNFEVQLQAGRSRVESARDIKIEYNFTPLLSAEVELGSRRSRLEPEREREIELGMRYVLVDHNRDDWGLALKLSGEWEREYEEEGRTPWRFTGPTALAAFVLPLAGNTVRLHANAGIAWRRHVEEHRKQALWGVGAEVQISPAWSVFAEHAVRRYEDRVHNAGLRWWVKREKVAVQWSASRTRDWFTGERVSGVHVGITFSDLSH